MSVEMATGDPEVKKERRRRRRGEPTLLRYLPGNSPVHRLWAGTKLIVLVVFTYSIGTKPGWNQLLAALGVFILALIAARIPRGAIPRPSLGLVISFVVISAIPLLIGGHPYVRVPLPLVGHLTVGLGSFLTWLRVLTVLLVSIGIAALFGWTTPQAEIAPAIARLVRPLKWLRLPVDDLAVAVALSLRFLPMMMQDLRGFFDARRLRKMPPPSRPREGIELLGAILTTSLRRSADLAAAIEARGGVGTVPRGEGRFRFGDAVALLIAGGFIFVVVHMPA